MNIKKLMLLAGLTAFCGIVSGPAFAFSMAAPGGNENYLMSPPQTGGAEDTGDANIFTGPALDFNSYGQEGETGEQSSGTINQYSKKFRKKPVITRDGGLLPSFSYKFQFIPVAGNDINNVILRFITPAALTGCMSIIQPAMVIEENPPAITVKLHSAASIRTDNDIRYAPYHCDKSRKFAQVDVPLSHTMLVEKGIKKIILNGGPGMARTLDVHTEDNKIQVISGNEIAVFPAQ